MLTLKKNITRKNLDWKVLICACLAVNILFLFVQPKEEIGTVVAIVGMTGLITAALLIHMWQGLRQEQLIILILIAGFILRLAYVLYTGIHTRQHDVYNFDGGIGHAGYISYFLDTFQLPDFDPRDKFQYYHPMLHHVVAAVWMRINLQLGMAFETACKSVQLLTLFYSSACMLIAYRIFRLFKWEGLALLVPTALVCLHPSLIILAGSINNDILSVTLMFASVYAAMRWNRKPTVKRIIPVALCIGGAMMAKTSGVLVAPAVAFLFLRKAWKDRQHLKKYLVQFLIFGVICIPLGLWWSVYCNIRWDVPLGYVPTINKKLADYSVWERFFAFEKNSIIYMAWESNPILDYSEYNIPLALLKTSLFDERTLFFSPRMEGAGRLDYAGYSISVVLFWVNLLLVAISLLAMIILAVKRERFKNRGEGVFFFLLWFVLLAMFVIFCFQHPTTCTQEFRYAVPTLLTGAVFIGKFIAYLKEKVPETSRLRKAALGIISGGTAGFCCLSYALYTLLGMR